MNVTVLAAVGVVRRRTPKNTGQATAVETMPTPSSDTIPSRAGVPGAPESTAAGSARRAPAVSMPVARVDGPRLHA
jgi:hypothetical protein